MSVSYSPRYESIQPVKALRDALRALADTHGVGICHVESAVDVNGSVIVWQEINVQHAVGDDGAQATMVAVQIDFFSDEEYDDLPAYLEEALDGTEAVYYWVCEGLDFDAERQQWRTIWTCRVC